MRSAPFITMSIIIYLMSFSLFGGLYGVTLGFLSSIIVLLVDELCDALSETREVDNVN